MAQSVIVSVDRLDAGLVLAPERYDPRRTSQHDEGVRIGDLVRIVADQVPPRSSSERVLILDTSNAEEGVIRKPKAIATVAELGSAKKRLQPGDVIISRLRPYLRQVALVDEELCRLDEERLGVVCSTEFFVLRAHDGTSIAFLVPFLLSSSVQSRLAAAQEGGHHPRFNHTTLSNLVVSERLIQRREQTSRSVERAVGLFRQSEQALRQLSSDEEAESHSVLRAVEVGSFPTLLGLGD